MFKLGLSVLSPGLPRPVATRRSGGRQTARGIFQALSFLRSGLGLGPPSDKSLCSGETRSEAGAVLVVVMCPTVFYVLPRLQVFLEAESVSVAAPEVFAPLFAAADLSPEGVVLVVEPGVVFAAVVFAAGPESVSAAPFSIVRVSGPQGSEHTHAVSAVSIPVSVVV